MFTVLAGPVICLAALAEGHAGVAAGFALWLLLSRVAHSAIAWRHGRRGSAFYVPLVLLSDWATALTKIWVMFHPAKQAWLNRGARHLDTTRQARDYSLRAGLAHYLWGFTCAGALLLLGVATGVFPLWREARLFLGRGAEPVTTSEISVASEPPNPARFGSLPGPGHPPD
jgi:hypothetical protein